MKKQMRILQAIGIFMFALTVTAFAKDEEIVSRVISISEFYSKLEVKGDVSVVFVNEPIGSIVLKGHPADVTAIKSSVASGTLVINARKKLSFKKLTIYIPVNTLTHVVVNGDSELISTDKIEIRKLSIKLNGFSEVRLNTNGNVCVEAVSGYELEPLTER